jgi:hypothetical protein
MKPCTEFVEYLAPTSLPDVSESIRTALAEAGIEFGVAERLVYSTPRLEIPPSKVPEIAGATYARTAKIRLYSGCANLAGIPFSGALLIGLDSRVHSTWRLSAFFSAPSPTVARAALHRLILDPLYTGTLPDDTNIKHLLRLRSLRASILRHHLEHLLPLPQCIEFGRVLWVDANPSVDTVLEPYGLSILSEIARKRGFLSAITAPFTDFARPEEAVASVIARFKPHIIGLSLRNLDDAVIVRSTHGLPGGIDTVDYLAQVRRLVSAMRASFHGPVILGGASLTRSPAGLMRALKVDYGVYGPGDSVIDELFLNWRPDGHPSSTSDFEVLWRKIPGAICVNRDTVGITPTLAPSRLPSTVTLVPRDPAKLWCERRLKIATAVRGSYGCPLNCTYCVEATPRIRVQHRDADSVVDEMQWMLSKYRVRHFHLTDSEANLPFSRMTALAAVIARRRLGNKLAWTAYVTPVPFEVEAIPSLLAGGLRSIKVSIDHFAPSQLKSLGKVHTEESICRLLDAIVEVRGSLQVSASILFGAPGETISTIDYAVDKIRRYSSGGITFYYNVGIRLYPGTPLFEDWRKSRLDARSCYGPGVIDGGISPLVYCAPGAPRVLSRKIADGLEGCRNARSIAPWRATDADESLRLLHVAAASWHRGDLDSAVAVLDRLGISERTSSNVVRSAFRVERELRMGKGPELVGGS